jgi:hypothetical protein
MAPAVRRQLAFIVTGALMLGTTIALVFEAGRRHGPERIVIEATDQPMRMRP